MAKYLTDLADVLRRAGLEVVEVPGWKTRGRPGDFNPTRVLCHHTAGWGDGLADATSMATRGRPDLSPPLAQLALSRKGAWFVLAAGRANHAGRCKAIGGLKPYPGRDYGDGNAQMLGVEAQNRGTNEEDWSPVQYAAYVRGVAALTRHYGWASPFGHKETSTSGKVDPDFDMSQFRRDVAGTNPTAAPQEDDDMKLTDPVNVRDPKTGQVVQVPYSTILARQDWVYQETIRQKAVLDAIAAKLLTVDEVKAATAAALDERIASATTVLEVKP